MAETSAIQWTDSTVNFWWGCTNVSPGCDHCYAETWNNFRGNKQWGTGAPRLKIKGAVALMRKLQRGAAKFFDANGRRRRVFMHSMSDVFDNEVDDSWRDEALSEAEAADQLHILLLTKRIGNVGKMVPNHWKGGAWPRHVGLMITIVNQEEVDRDIPKLLELKARYNIPWIGISAEPLLGPLDLTPWLHYIDWVICGGESGPDARPMHPDWPRRLRDQCAEVGVAFLLKQWGEWSPDRSGSLFSHGPGIATVMPDGRVREWQPDYPEARLTSPQMRKMERLGKHKAGRLLDGVEHNGFPDAISS